MFTGAPKPELRRLGFYLARIWVQITFFASTGGPKATSPLLPSNAMPTGIYLQDGDAVELEVTGLGALRQTCRALSP